MTESTDAPLRRAGQLQEPGRVPDTSEHPLTAFVLSVGVLYDAIDVVLSADEGPTRQRAAAQIDGEFARVSLDLDVARAWVARRVARLGGVASDGPTAPSAAGDRGEAP